VWSVLAIALRFDCLTEQAKRAAFEASSGNHRPLGSNKSSVEAGARTDPVLSVDQTGLP
jgi:hypothetical protein